jgi:uncharacterized protein YbaP (TraB family)
MKDFMKKVSHTLSLLILLTLTINQAHADLLWSNKKSGGDDFLLGTIHLGDERLSTLPDSIKAAIDSVDVVVIETDVSLVSTEEQQKLLLQAASLPPGQRLSHVLSPAVYDKAKQYLTANGSSIENLASFKPWLVGLAMVQMAYAKLELKEEYGIDKQVQDYALKQGKKVIGLETYAEQMGFFNAITDKYPEFTGDDLILDTLTEIEQYSDLPKEMITAWINSDLQAFEDMYQETLGTSKFDEAAEQVLIVERNHKWLTPLESMFAKQKVFLAVGALHFAGEDGLPSLMPDKFELIKAKTK